MPPSPTPPPDTPSAHDLASTSSTPSQPSASQPTQSSDHPIPPPTSSSSSIPSNPSPAVDPSAAAPQPPPPPPSHPFPLGTLFISFPFPTTTAAAQPSSPAGPPPNREEARARFFETLARMGIAVPGGGGAQSATPGGAQPQPSSPINENENGAGEDQALQDMIEEEMRRTFGDGDDGNSPPSAAQAQQPPSSSSPLPGSSNAPPPVGPSNFPFAGLAPMRFNFSPPSMNQLAAMFGGGNRPAQPPTADTVDGPAPPPPPPQGGTAATGAGGAAGFGSMPMAPDIMAQMRGFFPGLSVLPSSPSNGPAPPLPSSPPATGATNGLPTSPSSNASLPPDVDGAQPNPQATANPFLQSLIDSVLSQIIIPSDPNAPPPDPNAPPSEGHPIFVTLHFGGPPPQEDKEPDPERAKELLSALEKPERGLVLRLDRGLRLEEEEAGVEAGERTGARCSVCLDSLLDADDEEESEKGKEKEERDDVAMAEEKEGQEVLSLPCSHAFHRGCLGPWLEMHTNCPTCRFDLDPLSTTLRPNRTATTLPSRTSTPTPANPTPNNGSSSASSTSNANRPHPYSRPPTRPSTPQPPAPTPTSTSTSSSTPASSRPYTPPPARLTLLSRVLSLESSHHLRCSLPLCTHAPSSSHPQGYPTKTKMFSLVRAEGELAPEAFGAERKRWVLNGCEHVFHPSCLRIEEGVWMGGAREGEWDKEGRKKVWCPVRNCKGEGWVAREDWDGVDEEDGEEEMEVESGLNGNEKKIDVALMDLDQPATASAPPTTTAAPSTALETDVEFDLD